MRAFPRHRLSLFPLTPDPRFVPQARDPRGPGLATSEGASSFDVVYVGGLTVHKGVPLLVEAFRRTAPRGHAPFCSSAAGKRAGCGAFIEQTCAEDPRVAVRPGDPLPALRRARLYVHAAYEDGFAYAPAEALACGCAPCS